MRTNRFDLFSLSALGLAAAGVMALAGCATSSGGGASTAAAPAAAPTPAPAPAPTPEPSAPAGLAYAELSTTLKGPIARARQELIGQTVSVDLQRATGKGAVAGTYMVQAGDNVFFRCLSAERGFQGGPVSAEVRAVRMPANGATRTVELARCEAGGAAAPAPAATPAPRAAAPAPAPAPAAAAAAPAASGGAGTVSAGKPGMDARGNVVDSSKVEAGSGRTVKGINDYEGEITGNPGPGSKFTRLQIGMPVRQVTDLIGPPTDQGAYVTGKAFIPFYFGGDRHRYEMTYKGQGRLIFAGGGMGDFTSGNLIWIIHNPNESGYR